jgi:hypothetical protein
MSQKSAQVTHLLVRTSELDAVASGTGMTACKSKPPIND